MVKAQILLRCKCRCNMVETCHLLQWHVILIQRNDKAQQLLCVELNRCEWLSICGLEWYKTTVSIFDICMFIHFDKTHAHLCPYTIHSERLHMAWNMHVCVCVQWLHCPYVPQESPRNTAAHHCGVHGWCYARDISVHWPPRQRLIKEGNCKGQVAFVEEAIFLEKKSPLLDVFPASTSNSSHKISSLFAPTTKTMEKNMFGSWGNQLDNQMMFETLNAWYSQCSFTHRQLQGFPRLPWVTTATPATPCRHLAKEHQKVAATARPSIEINNRYMNKKSTNIEIRCIDERSKYIQLTQSTGWQGDLTNMSSMCSVHPKWRCWSCWNLTADDNAIVDIC